MFWLFYPLYVTRLSVILRWMQAIGYVLVWHPYTDKTNHWSRWFEFPSIERKDQLEMTTPKA